MSRKQVIVKRNQIINGLETVNPMFGFNTYSSIPNNVEYETMGIYGIIVFHLKTKKRKFYVGKANDINNRLQKHEYYLKMGIHENSKLQKDYNKGYRFRFQPLLTFRQKEIKKTELLNLETQFIYILRSHLEEYGYNTNASGIFIHKRNGR